MIWSALFHAIDHYRAGRSPASARSRNLWKVCSHPRSWVGPEYLVDTGYGDEL